MPAPHFAGAGIHRKKKHPIIIFFLSSILRPVVYITAHQKFPHTSPASIRFAPIKQALAVTVEPFKFSSRQVGVAYELS